MDRRLSQSDAFPSTMSHRLQATSHAHDNISPATGLGSTTLHDQQPHRHSHHRCIQPTTPFRLIDETNNNQVQVTPTKRLLPFHHEREPDLSRGEVSPDGSVSIQPATPLDTPTHPAACHRRQRTPKSSKFLANTSARRSRQTSALLASPARPGHLSRLRDLFEDASHKPPIAQIDETVSYPSLPNVSRVLEHVHLEEAGISMSRQGSPLPPSEPNSAAPKSQPHDRSDVRTTPTRSSTSTGSWSDDSGYLRAESSPRHSTPSRTAQPHVDDWLAALSLEDDFGDRCNLDLAPLASSNPIAWQETNHRSVEYAVLDGDDVELASLSPNVRVERGPSRKHSTPKDEDILSSPMVTPKVSSLLEEEDSRVLADVVNPAADASPVRSHARNKTRFWHPIGSRHLSHTRSR